MRIKDHDKEGCLDVLAGIKVFSSAKQAGVDELSLPNRQVSLLQMLLHLSEELNYRQ